MGKERQCIIKHSTKDLRQTTCSVIAETKRHTAFISTLYTMRTRLLRLVHQLMAWAGKRTGIYLLREVMRNVNGT